jgi:twitching motility protein PilT
MFQSSYNVKELMIEAVNRGASDLHLTTGSKPIYRIHGRLEPYGDERLFSEDTNSYMEEILTEGQRDYFLNKGEIDISYGIEGISRFRINVYKQRDAVGIAIRIIPRNIPTLEQLGVSPILDSFVDKPQGLILITGPTGSGKSTTLASMIDLINRTQSKHIITLEDPIEYLHRHHRSIINQREIGKDSLSFAAALRAALRQDPDVILVGEMRDLETIATAITAAETGHLVFATLHTADASNTIDRIIDAFPVAQQTQIRLQIASVLVGVVAQRLLPTIDRGRRVAAMEILINTPAVSNLIRSEKTHQLKTVMQTSKLAGMETMESAIRRLVANGKVDVEIACQYVENWDRM